MKKNKFYIYFSCLLIAFIVFVSFGVNVSAFTNNEDIEVTNDYPYIYNDDYEINISYYQPLVANYYYTDVQGAKSNYNSDYTYGYYNEGIIGTNGDLQYINYEDIAFIDDTLYNQLIIRNPNNIIGLGYLWGFGFSNPIYIDYQMLLKFATMQNITFNGISESFLCYTNIKFSYLIKEDMESPYEIRTFTYSDFLVPENEGVFTDDMLQLISLSPFERAFNEEEPYYQNPIIKIDYIYTYFVIDGGTPSSSDYQIEYTFPLMSHGEHNLLRYNVTTWQDYDISLGPIDIDIGESLLNSVNSFLQFQLFPNFTLFNLLMIIICVPLLIYILKLFLGG